VSDVISAMTSSCRHQSAAAAAGDVTRDSTQLPQQISCTATIREYAYMLAVILLLLMLNYTILIIFALGLIFCQSFGPHRMHEMRTRSMFPGVSVSHYVCQSVCLSVMQLRCANKAERIDILLGMEILGTPRNVVNALC